MSVSTRIVPTVYFVPAFGGQSSDQEVIEAYYQGVFEEELVSWSNKPTDWPVDRSLEVFMDWFDISIAELVMDVKQSPLKYIK